MCFGINPTGSRHCGQPDPAHHSAANASLASIPTDQQAAWIQHIQATLPDLQRLGAAPIWLGSRGASVRPGSRSRLSAFSK